MDDSLRVTSPIVGLFVRPRGPFVHFVAPSRMRPGHRYQICWTICIGTPSRTPISRADSPSAFNSLIRGYSRRPVLS